jgi:hypothetical protein
MDENMIVKEDVHEALIKMERYLFNGAYLDDSPHQPVSVRMSWVFSAAYVEKYYPAESELLTRSFRLLNSSGCYYNTSQTGEVI